MLALGIKGLELEVLKMKLEGAEVEKVFVRTSPRRLGSTQHHTPKEGAPGYCQITHIAAHQWMVELNCCVFWSALCSVSCVLCLCT
jgi:hypothetical protein